MNKSPRAFGHIYLHGKRFGAGRWWIGFFILLGIVLFLPWTQTVRGKGAVISLRQEQRPQQINTTIGGSIVKWYVKEGDFVKAGDTLIRLSEVKAEYFDPNLVRRTGEQIEAKKQGIDAYRAKAEAADLQISALQSGLQLKLSQLQNKLRQLQVKLQSDSVNAVAAANELKIATAQLARQNELYKEGLASLVQLEQRNQAYQNAAAKKVSADNKLIETRQELAITRIEMSATQQEVAEKTAKAEGDRFQSLSEVASGTGEVAKLENQYANYAIRNGLYYILAPQDGQIIQAKKAGIGEILKEGEMVVNIVPDKVDFAVELFVRPVDLPLVAKGQSVMFLFDGFPAIVFSGWPQASSGTFRGKIVAVERNVSDNGRFRVLVAEDPSYKPWPPELKMGTGANGLALLKDVPVWYELWRNINSFPPDYYNLEEAAGKAGKTAKK